jgi:hypothetical protein
MSSPETPRKHEVPDDAVLVRDVPESASAAGFYSMAKDARRPVMMGDTKHFGIQIRELEKKRSGSEDRCI